MRFKNFFITGGAGFIGSHFVDTFIAENKNVMIFDNLSSGKKEFLKTSLIKQNCTLIKGDLLKPNQLQVLPPTTDVVFHLAANPDISKGITDPTIDFQQTIVATFNLLQEMKKKKIKNLVYFSGSGVYGDVGSKATREDFGPLLPVSMYGASKLSAEALIAAFSNLYGIKTWIFRPANIIGDRLTHGVVFDFIAKLRKNPKELLILGDGKQSKSYLYIADVVDAVFLGLQKSHHQINLFNIASSTYITVNDIADLVVKGLKLKNVKLKHTPGKIGWPGDVPVVRIDNTKLEKLGWKEKYTSKIAVQQTITDIIS